ncbi:MAG: hypothetical protein JWN48_5339 [Myxococcaceae bacterium]|nr:hypothetical protein [Myxococcaceae bacterium]
MLDWWCRRSAPWGARAELGKAWSVAAATLSVLAWQAGCALDQGATGRAAIEGHEVGAEAGADGQTSDAGLPKPPASDARAPVSALDAQTTSPRDASPDELDAGSEPARDGQSENVRDAQGRDGALDTTGTDAAVDAGPAPVDAAAEGAGGWWSDLPPNATCGAAQNCDLQCKPKDDPCVLDCLGHPQCASTCAGGVPCHVSCAGSNTCTGSCKAATDCSLDCRGAVLCSASCDGEAHCSTDCRGADRCASMCKPGATCDTDCTGADTCTNNTCGKGASCLLRCGDGTSCGFATCEGAQLSCPGGVLTCNRDCP